MNPRYSLKFKLEQNFRKSGRNGNMKKIYMELGKLLAKMWLKSTLFGLQLKKKKTSSGVCVLLCFLFILLCDNNPDPNVLFFHQDF